jgi:hypothetical protein
LDSNPGRQGQISEVGSKKLAFWPALLETDGDTALWKSKKAALDSDSGGQNQDGQD